MKNQIKLVEGQKVVFSGDELPYSVISANDMFVICTRALSRRHDSGLLWELVESGGYSSFTSAYESLKESPVYTIVDFERNIRGAEDCVFCMGFGTKELCDEALDRLTRWESSVSHRNSVELSIVNVIKK